MRETILNIKIDILRRSKEFSIDEIHGYLKVLGFKTDHNYGQFGQYDYLSWSIDDVNDIETLTLLQNSLTKESRMKLGYGKMDIIVCS